MHWFLVLVIYLSGKFMLLYCAASSWLCCCYYVHIFKQFPIMSLTVFRSFLLFLFLRLQSDVNAGWDILHATIRSATCKRRAEVAEAPAVIDDPAVHFNTQSMSTKNITTILHAIYLFECFSCLLNPTGKTARRLRVQNESCQRFIFANATDDHIQN